MGMTMEPSEDTSATALPEMPPKNMESSTFTYARPPRKRPTTRFARPTIFSEMPPAPMNSPITMKNGMESSEKLFAPSIIWRIMTDRLVSITSADASVASSMAKETGTLSSISSAKPPIRMMPASVVMMPPPLCAAC